MAEGTLQSNSSSSAATSSSGGTGISGACEHKRPPHSLITTSIKQKRDLESTIRASSVSKRNEQNWIEVYSLESLNLTLNSIMDYCKLPRQQILVEFPFAHYLSLLDSDSRKPPASPSRPQTNIDLTKLESKRKELKLLIKFYKKRIRWLSTESRQQWGLLLGSRVVLVVEDSQSLAEAGEGETMKEYKAALMKLTEEQLVSKNMVHLVKYGGSASPRNPQGLPFIKFKPECVRYASDWIASLEGEREGRSRGGGEGEGGGEGGGGEGGGEGGEQVGGGGEEGGVEEGGGGGGRGGSCNLLEAVKLALELDIDTICVVLYSKPNQPLDVVHDYIVDRLSGENAPALHLVAFNAPQEVQTALYELATECKGHFHSYSTLQMQEDAAHTVSDTDIQKIREEIVKAEAVVSGLKSLECGALEQQLIETLREISLSTDWEEDDDFPFQVPPTGDHCSVCTTANWLIQHGIESQKLNLYRSLAPNAYPQLQDYVQLTKNTVVSQVYNVMMPLIPWEDGSLKYLHVDVHGIESYLSSLQKYIVDKLQARLSWLQSGSRVPFGVLVEPRVLLVVDSSCSVLGQILKLQQHFRLLLEEQVAYVQEFNLIGCGTESRMWTTGFAEPNRQSLLQAWEWVLGISPAGSNNLLSTLKLIFESDSIFEEITGGEVEIEDTGIYLVMSSMPDQTKDVLCSYLEQITAGHNVSVNVVYYNTEPLSDPTLYTGSEGGRFGADEEVEDCLQSLAVAGKGRFHHFRVSGSFEGDDVLALMEEIDQAIWYLEEGRRILNDYRDFCRRNVSTPSVDINTVPSEGRHTPAPPLYPRQTSASLARMNACSPKVEESPAPEKRRKRQISMKDQYLYTGRGLSKVRGWELVMDMSPKKVKEKSLIPTKEEHISSKEWISRYGLQTLGLQFTDLVPGSDAANTKRLVHGKASTYKHVNHQGEVVELYIDLKRLKEHKFKLQKSLNRYHTRLQWLNKDENKCFGAILEREVVFLLDVSTSLSRYLQEIKEGLFLLLNHLPPRTKRFNLISFSSSVQQWQQQLVSLSKENIADAVQWLNEIKAEGNSYLLQALQRSLQSGATGVYLITDGTADHTHEFLLNQLSFLKSRYGHDWTIHTVGWHCLCAQSSQVFLKSLAEGSGGRFHSYPNTSEGDDCKLMAQEISLAGLSLQQITNFL